MSVNYDLYLRSPEWKARRAMMLDWAQHRCQLCNRAEALQVHHRTYDRLGHEHPADLVVLCDGCHAKHHDIEEPDDDDGPEGTIRFPTAEQARALRNESASRTRMHTRLTFPGRDPRNAGSTRPADTEERTHEQSAHGRDGRTGPADASPEGTDETVDWGEQGHDAVA